MHGTKLAYLWVRFGFFSLSLSISVAYLMIINANRPQTMLFFSLSLYTFQYVAVPVVLMWTPTHRFEIMLEMPSFRFRLHFTIAGRRQHTHNNRKSSISSNKKCSDDTRKRCKHTQSSSFVLMSSRVLFENVIIIRHSVMNNAKLPNSVIDTMHEPLKERQSGEDGEHRHAQTNWCQY